MNNPSFSSLKLMMNPLAAFSTFALVIGLGVIGLSNILRPYKEKQRTQLYDIATNTISTNAIPGLLFKGNYQQAREMHKDMLETINESLRDTTAPSIFKDREYADFKARFGTWEHFYTNYVNQEYRELEKLANERVYNLNKPKTR